MHISLKYRSLILLVFSLVFLQVCTKENPLEPEQDDDVLQETVDSALVKLKEFYENLNNTLGTSITSTIQWLKTLPDVQDAYLSGGQILKIEFESGLLAGILFAEVDEQGRVITQGSSLSLIPDSTRRTLQKKISLPQQTFRFRNPGIADSNIILNKKILIYEPFADEFYPPNKGTAVKEILESSDINFEITHLKNQEATVEALFNLPDYGFIIIDTHGGDRGESFASGEIVNDANKAKYEILRTGNQFKIFELFRAKVDPIFHTISWGGEVYWHVNNRFIDGLDGSFPKSVIFNSSCESAAFAHSSTSLKAAFIGKGAKTYLGVTDIAGAGFLNECLLDFTEKFGKDLKTTGESFTPGRTYLNSHNRLAEYVIHGSEEMHYSTSTINNILTSNRCIVRVKFTGHYQQTNGPGYDQEDLWGNYEAIGSFSGNTFVGNYTENLDRSVGNITATLNDDLDEVISVVWIEDFTDTFSGYTTTTHTSVSASNVPISELYTDLFGIWGDETCNYISLEYNSQNQATSNEVTLQSYTCSTNSFIIISFREE